MAQAAHAIISTAHLFSNTGQVWFVLPCPFYVLFLKIAGQFGRYTWDSLAFKVSCGTGS